MDWLALIAAGVCEMLGVAAISEWHRRRNLQAMILLLSTFGGSMFFLALAMRTMPVSTAYAVWTGIGASGGAILGMLRYGESRSGKRIFFIVVVLGAAVGLKLVG
jgi:paired small multidrug resistance pump